MLHAPMHCANHTVFTCAHASMHQEGSICLAGAEPYSWAFSYMARPLATQAGPLSCTSQARWKNMRRYKPRWRWSYAPSEDMYSCSVLCSSSHPKPLGRRSFLPSSGLHIAQCWKANAAGCQVNSIGTVVSDEKGFLGCVLAC